MRRTAQQLVADRETLLHTLSGQEWNTTAEVATDRDPRQVYADLRALENLKWVQSQKVNGDKRLFWCVKCREVLTSDNYGKCSENSDHDLRPFYPKVKQWRLTAVGVHVRRRHHPLAA